MYPKSDENGSKMFKMYENGQQLTKNTLHAKYTFENEATTNPVTTQLTQPKTPRPNKILKNKSDINPESGFMARIYPK